MINETVELLELYTNGGNDTRNDTHIVFFILDSILSNVIIDS